MVKIKHYSRKFLNKAEGLAAIECSVGDLQFSYGVDASISITDCSRQVNIDFSIYNLKDLDSRLAKLNLLITEITKVRDIISNNSDAIKEDIISKEKKLSERLTKAKLMPTVCDDEL
jgi:hypothetical protein